MCGITVCIALNRQCSHPGAGKVNGDLDTNANRAHTDGHTNSHTNRAYTNGQPKPDPNLHQKLHNSLDKIAHRGPDARGVWISDDGLVGLGHNRLAINDLSPDGDQPIHSDDDTIHAVVNGEIYDYDRLRAELTSLHGYQFRGHSDSELVVALYKSYGAPRFLDYLRGEFALVVHDERTGSIVAARDRFGIKPLFWTVIGEGDDKRLLLAAEAKAFLALDWEAEWDVGSLVESGWASNDNRTLFKGVRKVMPGYWMGVTADGVIEHHRYFDIDYKDKREVETRSIEEMITGVRQRLTEAIRLRMRADVPIGIYLSGGLDSSLIAGIVVRLVKEEGFRMGNQDASDRIRCFTIQFPTEGGFDESDIAERTAEWLGVQISKKNMDESALAEYFADTAYHCEHHNTDLNSVGKFGLSMLPREQGFKVVLTGEGADEHFGGYPFFPPDFLLERDHATPGSPLTQNDQLREGMKKMARQALVDMFPRMGVFQHGLDDCEAFRSVNNVLMPGAIGGILVSRAPFAPWVREQWADADVRLTLTNSFSPEAKDKAINKWHPLHTSQYVWTKTVLANLLLSCLGDRTEMAHSVEARPPFLDHELSEYVNGLPPSLKLGYTPGNLGAGDDRSPWWGGKNSSSARVFSEKWILREAGKEFLTEELYQRKKHPYSAPVKWQKGRPIHQKLSEICTKEAIEALGFVDYAVVESALDKGFGEEADTLSFRLILAVAAWVTLGQRFGAKKASSADWANAASCL